MRRIRVLVRGGQDILGANSTELANTSASLRIDSVSIVGGGV